jgi:hypothetical protein
VQSLEVDRLAALLRPDWRLSGTAADEPRMRQIQMRLIRPAAGDLIATATTVQLARAKLADLIEGESQTPSSALPVNRGRAADGGSGARGLARPNGHAASDQAWAGLRRGASGSRQRVSAKPDRPVKSKWRAPSDKPRFAPIVQGAIDRVVERIAAEDAAAAASVPTPPRPRKSAPSRGVGPTDAGHQSNENQPIPGAPQGYPSASRLTHLRMQVKGSPGTGRRR